MSFQKRAAAYVRVASDENAEQRLADQEQRIREWAEAVHVDVIRVYSDIGSGLDEQRPGLLELMAAAETGEFSMVVLSDHSRLFRRFTLLSEYSTLLRQKHGIDVICVGLDRCLKAGPVRRVAGYASVDNEVDAEVPLDVQEAHICAWADYHGYELTAIYRDIGSDEEPLPGLQQLLAAAETGELHYIVLSDTTRLHRDPDFQLRYGDVITQQYLVPFAVLTSKGWPK